MCFYFTLCFSSTKLWLIVFFSYLLQYVTWLNIALVGLHLKKWNSRSRLTVLFDSSIWPFYMTVKLMRVFYLCLSLVKLRRYVLFVKLSTSPDSAVAGPAGGRGEAPGPKVPLHRTGGIPQRAASLRTQKRLGAPLA